MSQTCTKYYFIAFIIALPLLATAQQTEFTISSSHTKDQYVITIKNHRAAIPQHVVFVADGSLKLGQYILGTDENWKLDLPSNCVVITIAHTGDWHMKRRRDFIPSDAGGYKDEEFGHAKEFYLFLKEELIPLINKRIPKQTDRSFIGHSFSGLFSLYASLQGEQLFHRYFAISPSIWANYYELGKIEERFYKDHKALSGRIWLYAGSLEMFNKVLSSARDYYEHLQARKYAGLHIGFEAIQYANHFSVIKPAVDKIFKQFK